MKTARLLLVTVVASTLTLASCSSDDSKQGEVGQTGSGNSGSEGSGQEDLDPVSRALKAMDELGIEHTEPVRGEVQLSGAKESYDLSINGNEAGILVFPNEEALQQWVSMSTSFGGVCVTFGEVAISLNSKEGIQDSAKIAPELAEALGGEAHGANTYQPGEK